jgi:hypothetical protein
MARMTYPETNTDGYDLAELKRYRLLLRVDRRLSSHDLLPSHTIRALSRHPVVPSCQDVGSDPGDGLDSAVCYGFDEGVVVALVLVGVAGGEVADGIIESDVGAEVFGDGNGVA